MCLQIAKCLPLWYNLMLFLRGHLFTFSSSDWCTVTLSSIWPQRRRQAVWLTWRLSSICFVHVIIMLPFPGGVRERQTERYFLFIFLFSMHIMPRCEFSLAIMSCYGIPAYPPHLSATGTRSFIILPLLALAVFSSHAMGWVQDAVGPYAQRAL